MAIIRRSGKYGVQVYRAGAREWVGTFDTFREAKEAEREAAARRAPAGRETWAEFAARWPDEYNLVLPDGSLRWSEPWVRTLRTGLRPFIQHFGPERIGRFPVADALPWARSQSTLTLRVVRAMMNDAKRSHLIDVNPFEKLGLDRSRGRADIVAITEEELELLAGLGDPMMRALILWQGYVGTRMIGAANLRREDVDLEARTVYVRKPGKKVPPRTIFIPPRAAEAVARMPRRLSGGVDRRTLRGPVRSGSPAESDWLFTSRRGSKLSKANLHYLWNPIRTAFDRALDPRRAEELRDARPRRGPMEFHELRHCAATIMARRGIDPQTAAWQLCQTDDGSLVKKVYTHLTDSERQGFMARAYGLSEGSSRVAGAPPDQRPPSPLPGEVERTSAPLAESESHADSHAWGVGNG